MKLDAKDRVALRQLAIYGIGACLICMALTVLIVLVALWIRLFLVVV